jgi:outer membrane protein insertion porin family
MFDDRPQRYTNQLKTLSAIALLVLAVSCGVVPKDYPHDKPFVYKTNIRLEGDFSTEDKNTLVSRLKNQLDDSIRVRTIPQLYREVLKKPPVFDSANADRSVMYMNNLLNSLGYFKDSISYSDTVVKKEDQLRTTVNFSVNPGKQVKLDSVSFNLNDTPYHHPNQDELQALAIANQNQTLLKKGEPFSKPLISAELDRLVEVFRNSGYLKFTRDELMGLWDTLDVNLLRPSLDPFEQLQLLEELQKRQENPTANLEIRLRSKIDSSRLQKFYIGDITIYPDYTQDTLNITAKTDTVGKYKVVYYRTIFKPKYFPDNIYLRSGDLYRQNRYIRTINRLGALGAWRLINIEQYPRKNSDTVDFKIRLTPAKKYSFNANLEGSRNSSIFSGNLFGLGVNLGLQNRNFARSSSLASTNLRFGTELNINKGEQFVQTKQVSLGNNIYFPRFIPSLGIIPQRYKDNLKTVLSFNASNTDRKDLFNLTSLNFSWGYEFQWRNKLFSLKIPNIEYTFLNKRDSLIKLIAQNPSLQYIFNDGLISSMLAGFTITGGKRNYFNVFRTNAEVSGLLASVIKSSFINRHLWRYVKIDADFTHKRVFKKSAMVFHAFAGVGVESQRTANPDKRLALPFYKQYYAGGPNSMRAWPLRQLGPGSTVKFISETPDRFGDIQLEGNIEYRFAIATIADARLEGALFTDIGNIWFLRPNPDFPNGSFNFSNLGRDIAIGAGYGLRVDFGYFLIRLDYAYKVKDPSPEPINVASQNKWFYNWKPFNGQFQLGINYPFGN